MTKEILVEITCDNCGNTFPKGLLLNFGAKSLQYKLMFNPKYNSRNQNSQY